MKTFKASIYSVLLVVLWVGFFVISGNLLLEQFNNAWCVAGAPWCPEWVKWKSYLLWIIPIFIVTICLNVGMSKLLLEKEDLNEIVEK